MPDPRTRPSLLERLRDASDTEAWARFEETYAELITGYCMRRGIQASDADDIRQVTFVKLLRSLKSFAYQPGRGRFRDYLYRVVRSAIADRLGQRARSRRARGSRGSRLRRATTCGSASGSSSTSAARGAW